MRETGRGGSVVAATIAALQNRAVVEETPRSTVTSCVPPAKIGNVIPVTESKFTDERLRRASCGSERPLSTASEASERDSTSVQSSEEPPPQDMSRLQSFMSDCEYLTEPFDEEQERAAAGSDYVHPAVRSYMYSPMGGDSDSPDETTVKCTVWSDNAVAGAQSNSSESDSSASSDEDSDERKYVPRVDDADYRTLTPSTRLDNSTRCDDDFKWMPPGDMEDEVVERRESRTEDYPAASLDRRRRTPSDRSDRDKKSRSSLTSKPPQHPSSVRASPRPQRPRHDDTPSELQRRWNSYEHFRWPEGAWWPPMCWCHGPPVPPPCCMHDRTLPSHHSLPQTHVRSNKNDADDRVRRLDAEKESLLIQIQVLTEQIGAQSEKIVELERALYDTRHRLNDANQNLHREMLQTSALEAQKLDLLARLTEATLRTVPERDTSERRVVMVPDPMVGPVPFTRPPPPRTPPANYGRQIERNTFMYSSLPRSSMFTSLEPRVVFGNTNEQNNMVVARGQGQSVPNLAERAESIIPRGSPSPSLRDMRSRVGSASTSTGAGIRLEGDELARSSTRATPRQKQPPMPWQTTPIREWDCNMTCGWLDSVGLGMYISAAKVWLGSSAEARGVLASASQHMLDKELGIKHPLHKKKIVLAVMDLLGNHDDALLTAAGRLDTSWVLSWLEDVGVSGARQHAQLAALDGRLLHRLAHGDLYTHLQVTLAVPAYSIKRGIQVLRDNNFNPDTMIRRGVGIGPDSGEGDGDENPDRMVMKTYDRPDAFSLPVSAEEVARWSSHRVMQWLKQIDLAEYASNLRGAGVHGGLMLLEPRFTAELMATLLNIPLEKTLLRRHLTHRFNDLLGREVIQQKRSIEQTPNYQKTIPTTKYKIPKKSSFPKIKKNKKGDLDLVGDLVCPLNGDEECPGEIPTSPKMKVEAAAVVDGEALPDVSHPCDPARTH